jgi:hypothetical protein
MGVCCCAVVLLSMRHKEDSTRTISRTAKEDSSKDKGEKRKTGNSRRDLPNCYSPNCQGSRKLCRHCSIYLHYISVT